MPEKTWQVKWKAAKIGKGAGIPCWMLCAATNISTKEKTMEEHFYSYMVSSCNARWLSLDAFSLSSCPIFLWHWILSIPDDSSEVLRICVSLSVDHEYQ